MEVSNAVNPTPEQLQAFLSSNFSGPVAMLNLLKYKDRASYADGRETDLTGEQAYGLYGEKMAPFVLANGGKLLYAGSAEFTMLGSIEKPWDSVAIMEYPSKEAFVEIVSKPEVQEFAVHRMAGLEGQLLIATSQRA
jgi:uncharacterized protein (DUF1330 family)